MRVAFQDQAIFEGAGSLSSALQMTYFWSAGCLAHEAPFATGGEACAAAAVQPGFFQLSDHFSGGHGGQGFAQGLVTVVNDIIFDVFGVDNASPLEYDALFGWQSAFARRQPGNAAGQLADGS